MPNRSLAPVHSGYATVRRRGVSRIDEQNGRIASVHHLSLAHTEAQVDATIQATAETLMEMGGAGVFVG